MSRVHKQHGWVYRGVLFVVTVLGVLMGVLWGISLTYNVQSWWPVNSTTTLMIDLLNGDAIITYDRTLSWKLVIAYHGPELPRLAFILDIWSFEYKTLPVINGWVVVIPMWFPFIVLIAWPVLHIMKKWPRRIEHGQCTGCGYDLRGSQHSSTCPECGEAIEREKQS